MWEDVGRLRAAAAEDVADSLPSFGEHLVEMLGLMKGGKLRGKCARN